MRRLLLFPMIAVLAGCGDSPAPAPKGPPSDPLITARASMILLADAIDAYRKREGNLPSSLEDALKATPKDAPLVPSDPWGHRYDYSVQGEKYSLRSAGPDGRPMTDDDVVHER